MSNFNDIKKLIGNTPIVDIEYTYKTKTLHAYAKLEWFNLSGSIKDRPAYEILKSAYESGKLKKDQIICETTSGNMGISLCAIAKLLGNPVVICMPKTMSKERQELLKLFGAKLELTDSFKDAFQKAEEYKSKGAFLTYQFENENNKIAHYQTTGKEILDKVKNISCFVSGVGTGGTLMGAGEYLKKNCNAKVIAIDPQESSILTNNGTSLGKHKIQGLSDGIIPKLYNESMVDKIIPIKSDDAIAMAKKLSRELGLSVGLSSGANFLGCVLNEQNNASTVFSDDSKKYLSTDLVLDIKSSLVDEITLVGYKVV